MGTTKRPTAGSQPHRATPQLIAARRRTTRTLREAVESGDVAAFEAALFSGADGHREVTPAMADALRYGFVAPMGSIDGGWSLAELCFHHQRPELLRIAIEAEHPAEVGGLMTANPGAWVTHLCTRHLFGQLAHVSLVAFAAWQCRAHSVTFIELGLEFHPEDPGVDSAELASPEGAALVREAAMRLRLRQCAATSANLPTEIPAPRRSRAL